MTVTEFGTQAGDRNALVATFIEVPAFWDAVIAAWARVPAAQPAAMPAPGGPLTASSISRRALSKEMRMEAARPDGPGRRRPGRPGRAGMPWACRQTGERDEEIDRIIRGHHGQLRHGGDHGGERVRGAGRSGPALLRDPVGDPAQGGRVHGADPGAERPRRAASLL